MKKLIGLVSMVGLIIGISFTAQSGSPDKDNGRKAKA